jgi:hypothetical protein
MGNGVSKDDLDKTYQAKGEYALSSDLINYQPKGSYALQSELGNYQPKGNYLSPPSGDQYTLKSYTDATYQPKGSYALQSDLGKYQAKGDYVTQDYLKNKYGDEVKKFTDATYQAKGSYALQSDLQNALNNYSPKNLNVSNGFNAPNANASLYGITLDNGGVNSLNNIPIYINSDLVLKGNNFCFNDTCFTPQDMKTLYNNLSVKQAQGGVVLGETVSVQRPQGGVVLGETVSVQRPQGGGVLGETVSAQRPQGGGVLGYTVAASVRPQGGVVLGETVAASVRPASQYLRTRNYLHY